MRSWKVAIVLAATTPFPDLLAAMRALDYRALAFAVLSPLLFGVITGSLAAFFFWLWSFAGSPLPLPAGGRMLPVASTAILLLSPALAVLAVQRGGPAPKPLTQADIDKAVLHTLNNKTLPSPAAKAAAVVGPSVVRVRGVEPGERGDPDIDEGVGTGVVIVDTGMILTNLHVVLGAEKVMIEFADGHEADAALVSTQPQHDLAVVPFSDRLGREVLERRGVCDMDVDDAAEVR